LRKTICEERAGGGIKWTKSVTGTSVFTGAKTDAAGILVVNITDRGFVACGALTYPGGSDCELVISFVFG
jgi:hypothetical protein